MLEIFNSPATDPNPDLSEADRQKLFENVTTLTATCLEEGVVCEPGDAVGFTQTYYDSMQALGARYYASRRFEDGSMVFRRLLQLKPMQPEYCKGLGACLLGMQKYADAESAYAMAYFYNAEDPEASYYLGLAAYFQKKFEPAFDSLRFARVMAEEHPQPGSKIAEWSTQLLLRIQPLLPPEKARLIDKRPG